VRKDQVLSVGFGADPVGAGQLFVERAVFKEAIPGFAPRSDPQMCRALNVVSHAGADDI
jgi:hypothetical protein